MNKKRLLTLMGGSKKIAANLVYTATGADTATIARITPTVPIVINWGDGDKTLVGAGNAAPVTHAYAGAGTYNVSISGNYDNITYLDIRDGKFSFAAGTIGKLKNVITLVLNTMTSGAISAGEIASLTKLQTLNLNTVSPVVIAAGEIGSLTALKSLTVRTISGLVIGAGEIGALTNLESLYIYNQANVTIAAGEIGGLTNLTYFYVRLAALIPALAADFATLTKIGTLQYENSLTSTQVDNVLAAVYGARNNYLTQAKTLNIATSNAAPGGTYKAANPPTTGLEYKYELLNDSEGQGFSVWTAINTTNP